MFRNVILFAAILSLFFGLWSAWSFFTGALSRSGYLTCLTISTIAWFLLATLWATLKAAQEDRR